MEAEPTKLGLFLFSICILAIMAYTLSMEEAIETCAGCIRASGCHQWANFCCHDEHVPMKCGRFTTDPDVLAAEVEALIELRAEMAQAEIDDPVPF